MASKKIITVFGATGQQGGSVVDTFLNDSKLRNDWAVRAVTRDVTKDSAKSLASKGAEVVSADLNDAASLQKAMEGAYAVFAVTNYWESLDQHLEVKQGKALVDAAKATGVKLFIWSELDNITKLSGGKLPHIYHFDSKAEIGDYARASGVPTVAFKPGFYMSNISGNGFRQTPPNNYWTFSLPVPGSSPIPLFDTADTGKYIKAIVLHSDKLIGGELLGATYYLTADEVVERFKATFPEAGKTARFNQLPHDVYKSILQNSGMPEFVAEELLENMRLLNEFGYFGGRPLEPSLALVEDKLTTFEEHLKRSEKLKNLK